MATFTVDVIPLDLMNASDTSRRMMNAEYNGISFSWLYRKYMVVFSGTLNGQLEMTFAYVVIIIMSKLFSANQSINLLLCVIDREVIKFGKEKTKNSSWHRCPL